MSPTLHAAVPDALSAFTARFLGERVHDPRADGARSRAVIADAIDAWNAEHMGRGDQVDPERALASLMDDFVGLGPLQPLLDDPAIEEIWIDSPSKIFVCEDGRPRLTSLILTSEEVRDLVERMLRASGRRLDLSTPFVDAMLPGGERLHAVIPPITQQHFCVNIRKHLVRARRLDDLVDRATLSAQAARFLSGAVVAGMNILVTGATQAGKTTLLRALAGQIPAAQRVITCEEVFELCLPNRDVVAMQTRPATLEGAGEVVLRDLVKETLRMRPERIIIGEVRGAESLDMLIAMNAGVSVMSTLHANSARDALSKLCVLPLLAGPNVSADFVVPTVAGALDLVVHIDRDPGGRRAVTAIVAVTGRAEDNRIEAVELFTREHGALIRSGFGWEAHERFAAAGLDLDALLAQGEG